MQSAFRFIWHNNELCWRTAKDLLLKYSSDEQTKVAMGEVDEDICGTHQYASKTKCLLHRAGFYWPTMIVVAFANTMGAKSANGLVIFSCFLLRWCILLSRSFRGWGLDFISQIHPSDQKDIALYWLLHIISQSGSKLCLWRIWHNKVIEFITEHIIHRFGIP